MVLWGYGGTGRRTALRMQRLVRGGSNPSTPTKFMRKRVCSSEGKPETLK